MSDNLYLFANNNGGQAEGNGSYRLYDMKIEGEDVKEEGKVNYADYIEGDGTSWINTGIQMNTKSKFELIYGSNLVTAWEVFFGATESFWVQRNSNTNSFYLYYNSTIKSNVGNMLEKEKNTLTINANKFYLNGELIYQYEEPSQILNSGVVCLFSSGKSNAIPSTMKCYGFKMYNESDTLLLDLRPCFDKEGVSCMYDEVSKKYFYNNGTGKFKCTKLLRDFQPVLDSNNVPCLLDKIKNKFYYNKSGEVFKTKEKPKYKKLPYLKGDRVSWIETNLYTNPQFTYETKIQDDTQNEQYESMFGTVATSFNLQRESGVQFQLRYNGSYKFTNGDFKNETIVRIEKNKFYFDGALKVTFDETDSTTNYDKPLYLFRAYSTGNTASDCKIYYYKVWDGDNQLTLDLIPVLDQNNIPCMYDKVSEQFFYNQGTGTFGYEIEELDAPEVDYVGYLESTGTQYIDTGIPVYDNTSYEIKVANKESGYVFGVSGDYNMGRTELNMRESDCVPVMFSGGYKTCTFKNSTFGYPHTIKMTPTQLFIDGEEIQEPNWGGTVPSSGYKMRLFGYLSWQKSYITKSMVYYFKTYKGEELIQDLRPCLDIEGIPCMYDTVSKQYYYNQGTGQFSYGDRIGYTPIEYIESNGTQYIDTEVVPNENTDIDMTCRACDYSETPTLTNSYIMNGLKADGNKYMYGETDTTVQPNLVASSGATLTMGSQNIAQLDDDDIESATNNGWSLV